MISLLTMLRELLGPANVLLEPRDMAPYLTDWRKRYTGKALAVIRPGTTREVAEAVALCANAVVPIVPQGGNTGLVGGATPDEGGRQIVLSLTRLNRVRNLDALNNTVTVEAGCILQTLQEAARAAGRLFPLSLAAEGSCTIGGNLASNAGGTAVLRYGNARDLCLGLEVVTAEGKVWDGLRGLRKDNTGYDLRDLFIGSEGTLGIITAAVMKLYPLPAAQLTALAAVESPADAIALLQRAQAACGAALTGFELMSDECLELVERYFPAQKNPFSQRHPHYVLLELSDPESEAHAAGLFESLLEAAVEAGLARDVVIASSLAQAKALWHLRESIPLAQAENGKNIKHDISVPISRIPSFIETTDRLLQSHFPGIQNITFGHLGDGNLHYNIGRSPRQTEDELLAQQDRIYGLVHDSVQAHGGSISAEHGVGQLKREEILRFKPAIEMEMMRAIKRALDPQNLLNPGKVL
jgi:FAD/FMN-containing dehydrogenase